MDELIKDTSEANNNPALREDIIADIWNSPLGAAFESTEDIDKALSDDSMPAVTARALRFIRQPVIK